MSRYRKRCVEPGCKGFIGPNGKKFYSIRTVPEVTKLKPELVRLRKENAALRKQLQDAGVVPCV